MSIWLFSPPEVLPSPTSELASVALLHVRRRDAFLLHLGCWLASSAFLAVVNLLTTGLATPWSLWPIGVMGSLVLMHGTLGVARGRQRYAAEHRRVAATERPLEVASNVSGGVELRGKLLASLASAREALKETAPELTADLSRGETHALAALAWIERAEKLLSQADRTAELRQEAVTLLSRSGLGTSREAVGLLREEADLHEVASSRLEVETSRRRSILESFALALEGAIAAQGRDDLLAAVTGPIRDRMILLESALGAAPTTTTSPSQSDRDSSERIREEVHLARQLQQSILPKEAPEVPGLSVSHLYRPSNEVGGDFYDFYSLEGDRLLVALGDASGHGLDSSMVSSMAKSALYAHVSSGRGLTETMTEMNRMMWDTLGKRRLMTLALLEIDARSRLLTWTNGGQIFPLLCREGSVRELEAPSYPLGVRRSAEYPVHHEQLEAGDVLLVLTDGFIEALDADDEPFGWERLIHRLEGIGADDTEHIVDELSQVLRQHLADSQPQDDVTLIAIGVGPS